MLFVAPYRKENMKIQIKEIIKQKKKKVQRFYQEAKEIQNQPDSENRILSFNRLIAKKEIIKKLLISIDIVLLICTNYLINSLAAAMQGNLFGDSGILKLLRIFPQPNSIRWFWWLYLIILLFLVAGNISFIYKIKISLSVQDFNVEQKGSSRWTDVDELKKQYRQIDEKKGTYKGLPGLLISQHDGKHFIDDGNTNTLIIGITRAGKDEIFVQPSINDYSRSEQRPSLIVTDIKGESYRCSKKLLESRGYRVLLYNLSNMQHTISINYMHDMMMLYKNEDFAAAENLAYGFAYPIFSKGNDSENSFFWENAASLFSALIIAHIDDCIYQNMEYNAMRKRAFEQKQEWFWALKEEEQTRIREELYLYEGKDLAMEEELKFIPPEIEFEEIDMYEKCANIYSVIVTFSELSRSKNPEQTKSALDDYFAMCPANDRAKLKYLSIDIASDRAKGDIYSSMAIKLTNFMQESVAKMSIYNDLDMTELGFGKQPIAVFIMVPDYEKSMHNLVSIFISQSYYMLAKKCDEYVKCQRPVRYILNEFGNIPKIENMANIVTVCLGRNITFDLYIQSTKQIETLYGKDAATIMTNCGNQIYLMGNDTDSAEYFSKIIGNKTYVDIQRNGEQVSLNKSFMEKAEQKPLLYPNELLELLPGNCVVRRAMKRFDLAGNKIRPRPIYNNDETGTSLKYRHSYLSDIMPDPDKIKLSEIAPPTIQIENLKNYILDYKKAMKRFQRKKTLEELGEKEFSKLKILLESVLECSCDSAWEIEKVYDMVKSTEIEENLKAKILRQLKRGMT